MYLEDINIRNIGPVDSFNYKFKFKDNKPLPVVIIGKNGKGKTILTSYIGDFFIEIAKMAYDNVVENPGAYFRVVGGTNVRNGVSYGYSVINSRHNDKNLIYCEKTGKVDIEREKLNFLNHLKKDQIAGALNNSNDNYKEVLNLTEKDNPLNDNVMTLFPSYRNEKPNWMNDNAIKYNSEYLLAEKINRKLNREIIVEHSEEINEFWLERLMSDAMSSITPYIDNNQVKFKIDKNIGILTQNTTILANVETILSKILRENVKLILNNRNSGSRISIKTSNGIIPSIKHLSLGESILFNLFITILRHGDEALNGRINDLKNIKGIVAIDEIDMHLDTDMQYIILPELISLFPGIQFIITSHSPLFLLGMNEKFNTNCDFIEMPTGENVNVENFEEFLNAYNCIKKTNKYNSEVKDSLNKYLLDNSSNNKPLIITEGETDWIHMKNAYEKLMNTDKEFAEKYEGLEFEFLEYCSSPNAILQIQMGDSNLYNMCDSFSRIPQGRIMIFIGDNDKEKIKNKLNDSNNYKKWGNNVFSLTIPVPDTRIETPNISIEHYYSDSEIKTSKKCSDNKNRRLFMGNEFNKDGFSTDGIYWCQNDGKCGFDKICVLDGEDGTRIYKVAEASKEQKTNYALSKKDFASFIQSDKIKISKESYNNFKLIFEKIAEIINNN